MRALDAGCDLLCTGSETTEHDYLDIVDTIVAAVESGRLAQARVADAAARVQRLRSAFAPSQFKPGHVAADPGLWSDDVVQQAFSVSDAAKDWLSLDAAPVVVQVASDSNLAVGRVAWGPEAAGLTTAEDAVPTDAKVAVAGRSLAPAHPAWAAADRLRAQGHAVIVVECGWPCSDADVVTYGGSPVVARALGRLLGVTGA